MTADLRTKLCWPLQRTYHVMGKVRSLRSEEKAVFFVDDVFNVDMNEYIFIVSPIQKVMFGRFQLGFRSDAESVVPWLNFHFALRFPSFSNSLICMEGSSVPNNLTRL